MNSRLTFQIISGLLLVAVLVLWSHSCQREKENKRLLSQVQLNETQLEITKNQLGEEVATFRAYQLSSAEMQNINDSTILSLKATVKYFKKLASYTSVTSITTDTVYMPANDSIVTVHDTVVHGKGFSYADAWLNLNGLLLFDTVRLKYSIKNNLSVDYYWKREHWWRRQEFFGSVTQSNPHTTTDRVVQFTVTAPPPAWYQKWWVNMLIGAGAGATATYILAK